MENSSLISHRPGEPDRARPGRNTLIDVYRQSDSGEARLNEDTIMSEYPHIGKTRPAFNLKSAMKLLVCKT